MNLKSWWKRWNDLVLKLIALTASFASLIGLLVVFLPSPNKLPWWAMVLVVFGSLCLVLLVVLECLSHQGFRIYAKNDQDGIKRYMHNWIEHGGRVAIWSRDMSWAQNSETGRLLKEKARHHELILCLPERNGFADELAAVGAEVCAYGRDYLESPASRFTIVFFGRDGARVAIGRADGDTHIIEEFSAGRHPA